MDSEHTTETGQELLHGTNEKPKIKWQAVLAVVVLLAVIIYALLSLGDSQEKEIDQITTPIIIEGTVTEIGLVDDVKYLAIYTGDEGVFPVYVDENSMANATSVDVGDVLTVEVDSLFNEDRDPVQALEIVSGGGGSTDMGLDPRRIATPRRR